MTKPLGLIVAMPTRGVVTIETMLCLRQHLDGIPHLLLTEVRKPVDVARNDLARRVADLDASNLDFEPTFVLWVDDDALWSAGTVRRAIDLLESNPEADALFSVYGPRRPLAQPLLMDYATFDPFDPLAHPDGELVRIRYGGMHWTMMRRDLLVRMGDNPFERIEVDIREHVGPFGIIDPLRRLKGRRLLPEDASFCRRANALGAKLFTERSLNIGHVSATDGLVYFPNAPARRSNGLDKPSFELGIQQCWTDYERRGYFAEDGPDCWRIGLEEVADSEGIA